MCVPCVLCVIFLLKYWFEEHSVFKHWSDEFSAEENSSLVFFFFFPEKVNHDGFFF